MESSTRSHSGTSTGKKKKKHYIAAKVLRITSMLRSITTPEHKGKSRKEELILIRKNRKGKKKADHCTSRIQSMITNNRATTQ